jgi:hypothetical protein
VKDENGDLLADSHSILNRQKNYYSQLLNVHNNVSDVMFLGCDVGCVLVFHNMHHGTAVGRRSRRKFAEI